MKITRYEARDLKKIVSLFYDTVHSVNLGDYTEKEVNAWAPIEEKESIMESWKKSLDQNITFVAKVNEVVVGFGDMTRSGHLDRLFVHKDYQRQGVATAIVDRIEFVAMQLDLVEIRTEASITAKSFFEHRGYKTVSIQIAERKTVELTNFKMYKIIKVYVLQNTLSSYE